MNVASVAGAPVTLFSLLRPEVLSILSAFFTACKAPDVKQA
ncbi:hypothetical protein [Pantoea sp. 1B4]|nr:hypothetical protein [Pantoea sp. 1B4]